MAYRDDRSGLEMRVRNLETDLSEARATIERLKGEAPIVPERDEVDSWTGAPTHLRVSRELPFEVTDRGHEAVADMLRLRFPGTSVAQVGRKLTHQAPGSELTLERTGPGQTRLTATRAPFGLRAGAIMVTLMLWAVAALPVAGSLKGLGFSPAPFVASLPFLLVAAAFAARTIIGKAQRTQRDALVGAFEAMAALAAEHPAPHAVAPPGVRIAPDAIAAQVGGEEQEHLAQEEAAEALPGELQLPGRVVDRAIDEHGKSD